MFEILITVYYWAVLYESDHGLITNIIGHALPMFSLLIEFVHLSTPFIPRHSVFSVIFGFSYLITNIVTTFAKEPPYASLSWDSPIAIAIPIVLFALSCGLHAGMVLISRWKLKKFGYSYSELTK